MLRIGGESDARKELINKSGNFSWAELVELEEAKKLIISQIIGNLAEKEMEIVVCSSSDKLDDLNKLRNTMNNGAVKRTTTHPIQAPSGVGVLKCANNILAIYELLVFGKSVPKLQILVLDSLNNKVCYRQ